MDIKAIRERLEASKKHSLDHRNHLSTAQKAEGHRARLVFDLHAPEDIERLLEELEAKLYAKACCEPCDEDGEDLKPEVVERLKESIEEMQERLDKAEARVGGLEKELEGERLPEPDPPCSICGREVGHQFDCPGHTSKERVGFLGLEETNPSRDKGITS